VEVAVSGSVTVHPEPAEWAPGWALSPPGAF